MRADPERQGLNGSRWVYRSCTGEQAAVRNEQVFNIVSPSPLVCHKTLGVLSHSCRAHKMKACPLKERYMAHLPRTRTGQNFLTTLPALLEHFFRIGTHAVVNLRRWES